MLDADASDAARLPFPEGGPRPIDPALLLLESSRHPPVEDNMLEADASDEAESLGPVAKATAHSAPCSLRTLPEDKDGSLPCSLRTLPEGKYRSHANDSSASAKPSSTPVASTQSPDNEAYAVSRDGLPMAAAGSRDWPPEPASSSSSRPLGIAPRRLRQSDVANPFAKLTGIRATVAVLASPGVWTANTPCTNPS